MGSIFGGNAGVAVGNAVHHAIKNNNEKRESMMFRSLLGLFKRRKESSQYHLLKRAIKLNERAFDYDKAYYIKGFEYSSDQYESLKKRINEGKFSEAIPRFKYDAKKDNVDFHIMEKDGGYTMIALLDYIRATAPN